MRNAIATFGLILVLATALRAGEARPETAPWDPGELRGFVDGVVEAQQKAHHFAGAVVVVVRGGQVIFQS